MIIWQQLLRNRCCTKENNMPKKSRFQREEILSFALALVKKQGFESLSARNLAKELGASSKVLFSVFASMQELRTALVEKANDIYQDFTQKQIVKNEYPPYKAMGMAYIFFAKEERELFKLLFMRDKSDEPTKSDNLTEAIAAVQNATGLCERDSYRFHLEMWVCVHGIATMIANNYLVWETNFLCNMITDLFTGLKLRYQNNVQENS